MLGGQEPALGGNFEQKILTLAVSGVRMKALFGY
jgi:hypothetical protein